MEGRNIEKGLERFPTKEEVLEVIGRFAENAKVTRESSDEKGLYLLEAEAAGREPGETAEYSYTRKGESPGHPNVADTAIDLTYYQDGEPIHGYAVALFTDGKWRNAEGDLPKSTVYMDEDGKWKPRS